MIRRDIRLADGAAGWLLISQVEHARISAELAARCTGRLALSPQRAGPSAAPDDAPSAAPVDASSPAPPAVCQEVLAAIRHHDDGWTQWEQAPRLDPQTGRPLTFTEIDPAEAVAIWNDSIAAAEPIGPLAAWLVAGHFARLAQRSDADHDSEQLRVWCETIDRRRRQWFAAWEQQAPLAHTTALAAEALQWLWTFDEVSLWLCCTCVADRPIPCAPEPYRAGRGTPIEMELLAAGGDAATARPWRYAVPSLTVELAGRVVPARRYSDPAELLAASAPKALVWRLAADANLLETAHSSRS